MVIKALFNKASSKIQLTDIHPAINDSTAHYSFQTFKHGEIAALIHTIHSVLLGG